MGSNEKNKYYNIDGYQVPILPMLSQEEEMELILRYQNGDQEAGKKIVEHNYGLVIKQCFNFNLKKISKGDLFQEGCLGLMMALDKYKLDSGNKFSTCAVWWVRHRMFRYCAKNVGEVDIAFNIFTLIKDIHRCEDLLSKKYSRPATREEIAKALGVSLNKIEMVYTLMGGEVSLDKPFSVSDEDADLSLYQVLPSDGHTPEEALEEKEKTRVIMKILDDVCKNEREKSIILDRFGFGDNRVKTFSELGEKYNITGERARQIQDKVLRKMKTKYYKVLEDLDS